MKIKIAVIIILLKGHRIRDQQSYKSVGKYFFFVVLESSTETLFRQSAVYLRFLWKWL